jgi:hypothetical protein
MTILIYVVLGIIVLALIGIVGLAGYLAALVELIIKFSPTLRKFFNK